jgi:hypothetical protein
MASVQRERLEHFVNLDCTTARTAYRRTRNGIPVWEMRAEDISGCLRTARGGSSKQAVVIMGRGALKIRWMTGLEYARLMGLAGTRWKICATHKFNMVLGMPSLFLLLAGSPGTHDPPSP